jgi:glucose-6-phosphate isomerase
MKYQGYANEGGAGADLAQATEYVAKMRRAMSDSAYSLPEASLRLPFDEGLLKKSQMLAAKLAGPKLAYILDIGIGGSNLGAKALYEATAGTLDAYTSFAPKILFADTCSPELLADITEIILSEVVDKEEIIIVVASKSGITTETITNASVLVNTLEQKFGSLADRIVCITDENSPLWQVGKKQKYHLLPIPKMVSGRFSVFSPLGLFPLLCAGVEGDILLRGAQSVIHDTVSRGIESDSFKAAQDIISWHEKGAVVFDFFVFHPELESVGKWYRQLFAESIGKEKTVDGIPTTHRIVPTVSIGSTDLHSVEQMNLAQPRISARFLVRAHASHWEHQFLADDKVFAPLVQGISHRAPCEVLDAIYKGVTETYHARGVSFGEILLTDLDPESLGALLQFMMCTAMHLANLLHINAFDQPNVEAYKDQTRRILSGGMA